MVLTKILSQFDHGVRSVGQSVSGWLSAQVDGLPYGINNDSELFVVLDCFVVLLSVSQCSQVRSWGYPPPGQQQQHHTCNMCWLIACSQWILQPRHEWICRLWATCTVRGCHGVCSNLTGSYIHCHYQAAIDLNKAVDLFATQNTKCMQLEWETCT